MTYLIIRTFPLISNSWFWNRENKFHILFKKYKKLVESTSIAFHCVGFRHFWTQYFTMLLYLDSQIILSGLLWFVYPSTLALFCIPYSCLVTSLISSIILFSYKACCQFWTTDYWPLSTHKAIEESGGHDILSINNFINIF